MSTDTTKLERWDEVSDDALLAGEDWDEAVAHADLEVTLAEEGWQESGVTGVYVKYLQYNEQIWGSLLVRNSGRASVGFGCARADWESDRRPAMIKNMLEAQ